MNSSAIRSPITATRRAGNASTRLSSRASRSLSPGSGWTDLAICINNESERPSAFQNQARRLSQVRHDRNRADVGGLSRRFRSAVPRLHENPLCSRRLAHFDIAPAISDDERTPDVERQLTLCAVYHTGLGLP